MIGIISILGNSQRREKVSHDWVVFSNPRNGKIRITACRECGTMLRGSANYRSCEGQEKRHPIIARGWKTDGKSVFMQPNTTNLDSVSAA